MTSYTICTHCERPIATDKDHICAEGVSMKTDNRLAAELEAEIELQSRPKPVQPGVMFCHIDPEPPRQKFCAVVTRITVEKYHATAVADTEGLYREGVISDSLELDIEMFEKDVKTTIGAIVKTFVEVDDA